MLCSNDQCWFITSPAPLRALRTPSLTSGQKYPIRWLFGGNWEFIILCNTLLNLCIVFNVGAAGYYRFDPYLFILMNLILSCIAALQGPVIRMSQNRQEETDRMRSENDYMINLKAEMQIHSLHQEMDFLLKEQIETLFKTQDKQLILLNEIKLKRRVYLHFNFRILGYKKFIIRFSGYPG